MLLFERDLRNVDIAKAKGIHPVNVYHHIQGRRRNPKIQEAITEALGVPLDQIILGPGEHLKSRAV